MSGLKLYMILFTVALGIIYGVVVYVTAKHHKEDDRRDDYS